MSNQTPSAENLEFDWAAPLPANSDSNLTLTEQLARFNEFGKETRHGETRAITFKGDPICIPTFTNEFWTAKQRAANSLHEISYRACFKPQLPRFFIERLSLPGEIVYDPFIGRGTSIIEAGLLGRVPYGCDINPLSIHLTQPRLDPPALAEVETRVRDIDFTVADEMPEELLAFYHPETLMELCALKKYLLRRQGSGELDSIDRWIWMVALNRLTGHSPGFFSVYTLPPNQAASVESQRRINAKYNQMPPRKHVGALIYQKTHQLLTDHDAGVRRALESVRHEATLLTAHSSCVPEIASGRVSLVVTSPPFLDVVNYAEDNWLRCWFIGVDANAVRLTVPKKLSDWQNAMTDVLREVARVLRPGGHVAFEVGEVRGGKVKLEEAVLPCGIDIGLRPVLVMINDQLFTKTANCWGVDNNSKGTNSNRVVVFSKT
jgi:hypothetical protein